jgi:hypothetical protein
MTVGQTLQGTITMKNVGTATWKAGVTKLSPTPRDNPSSLGSAGWLSATRVSSPAVDVAPGGSYDFPLELTAGTAGDFTQTFSLVEEGVTWFADAPKGGGPPDDLLAVHVIVSSAGGSGMGGEGTGGEGAGGSGTGTGGTGAVAMGTRPGDANDVSSACAFRPASGQDRDPAGAGWIVVGAAVVVTRRRRRGAWR